MNIFATRRRLSIALSLALSVGVNLAAPSFAQEGATGAPGETKTSLQQEAEVSGVKEVGASTSQGVALTIYNQNFGLVKDIRTVTLGKGINYLRFEDVAAALDPTSVNFMSLSAPNTVVVREQNYQYDVMDPETILSKSVGKEITFRQYVEGGRVNELKGILLNSPRVTIVDTNGNPSERTLAPVIKTDRGVVLQPSGEVEIAKLPEGLVSRPSLLWKLETNKPGEHKTEISYQTAGLNWRCDYVVIANEEDTAADMASWVTLDNKSGATYKNSSLKLMAGDVHRVQEQQQWGEARGFAGAAAADSMANQFSEKSFAEYHLYSLAGTTDVNNNETKQLSLFNANNVPTRKLFMYEPSKQQIYYSGWSPPNADPQKVNVKIEIENSEKNNLGMAIPKGKVRVYKRDTDGSMQFIGEDLVDHTPRDEKIRLYIGDAFDLVGERKQLTHEQPSERMTRDTYEISLRNHKDKKVTINAVEHAYGDWKIKTTSHPFKKKDSNTFEYEVEVPARGEVKINYEIEMKY